MLIETVKEFFSLNWTKVGLKAYMRNTDEHADWFELD